MRLRPPTPVLVRPPVPLMMPAVLPSEAESVVPARARSPPVRRLTVAVVPLKERVPPEIVSATTSPPTVTVPAEISDERLPVTLTVPPLMAPPRVAWLAKVVVPAPPSEARVMVPVAPMKLTVPALVTAPRFRSEP